MAAALFSPSIVTGLVATPILLAGAAGASPGMSAEHRIAVFVAEVALLLVAGRLLGEAAQPARLSASGNLLHTLPTS